MPNTTDYSDNRPWVNQRDLSTVQHVPGLTDDTPYYVIPVSECIDCVILGDGEFMCENCYKCCSCAMCVPSHRYSMHFVCPECGCRVAMTGCPPFQCLCIKGCGCVLCCEPISPEGDSVLLEALDSQEYIEVSGRIVEQDALPILSSH